MISSRLSRRATLAGMGSLIAGATVPAHAQRVDEGGLSGTVRDANLRPRPIAVPPFLSEDPKFGRDIAQVIANDLESSGLFIPLDPRSFIQQITDFNIEPRFADWRSVGAEAIVVGRVGQASEGRVQAEFRVWDVVLGKQLAGQRFTTQASNWRRIGHIIADQAWEKLTLERGYFDTRVVFIDETGPKEKRIKRLAIMDQDGENVRLLSQGQELVLTPRFSPTSLEITYMSYVRDQGRIMLLNIETGKRELVGDFAGITFAPRFSPDGQRIIMSQGQGGDSWISEMDLRTRQTRRLTQGQGIDTGPC